MSWTWHYETTSAATDDAVSAEFPTQSDAESWIGEIWQELLEAGVDAVVLFEDDHRVYGPMSLHPAD